MTAPDLEHIAADLRPLAVEVSALSFDDANAKTHDDIGAIQESLQQFGQRKPIVVNVNGMVAEAGNGTLEAALALGWSHIAVVHVDDDPETHVAYALADNRSAEKGSAWNPDKLPDLVGMLKSGGNYDLPKLGLSDDDLLDMLDMEALDVEVPNPEHTTEGEGGDVAPLPDGADEIPEEVEARTKAGDKVTLGRHELHCVDCVAFMRTIPDNSVHAIVTDPPYGIGFLGKQWDASVPGDAFAAEALRVLRPGGHIVAFAATRTVHRLAAALEDAGFDIRDQINWLTWQGFPKSLSISKSIDKAAGAEREVIREGSPPPENFKSGVLSNRGPNSFGNGPITAPATPEAKQWDGWGTALKPCAEPAVLARKPFKGTVAATVLEHGTGGLHIDACRHAEGDPAWPGPGGKIEWPDGPQGMRDQYVGGSQSSLETWSANKAGRWPSNVYHCPKPARAEKEKGLDDLPKRVKQGQGPSTNLDGTPKFGTKAAANIHPTVKPVGLMRWLLRLVSPPGALVLEPFAGSGTTIVAAHGLDLRIMACEREPEYCDIVRARVEALGTLGQ